MLVQFKKFNGIATPSGVRAFVINPGAMPSANPVFLDQAQADSDYSGAYTVDVRSVAVRLIIDNYASRYALISTIKSWFKRGTRGNLEVTFLDDGLDYLLDCTVVTPPIADKDNNLYYTVVLQTGMSAWRSVAAETSSWTVSGTGGTKDITVGGNDETPLSLDITPTVAVLRYQRLYQLVNVPGIDYGMRAWCITFDHATLVSSGKSRSDGYDLGIWLGDHQTPRWVAGANTATCKIWFNTPIPAGYSLVLATAVPASGAISELLFEKTTNSFNALNAMPPQGVVYHNNEWFYYGAKDPTNYQLLNITRQYYETPNEAHAAGVVFSFIGQPILLTYGDLSATNPASSDDHYDDMKPLFNLSASDNTKWVYDNTSKFYDPDHPGRPGEWSQSFKRNVNNVETYNYYIKEDAETGDPALGAKAAAYQIGSVWRRDTVEVRWTLYCPGTFSFLSATGQKYISGIFYPSTNGFQRSADGKSWRSLWTEAKPVAGSWAAWSAHNNVAVAAGSKYISMVFAGTTNANSDYAMTECLTIIPEFVSANLPTGTLLSETINSHLRADFSNTINQDGFTLNLPIMVNKLLAIDGEKNTVIWNGANMHRSIALNSEARTVWIRLQPGNNTISLSSADVGTLQIVLKWYRRRLY